ncbi:xylosidase/arabinosidase [Aureobasidium sp. EXF-10727]|nr:xylosidase/arabinosidase [Aureobasidium sp. EXF-10727]KAI4724431.1 xylosidase/arabinosidase [Aureobasidium sp. EXF-10728]
MISNDMTETVIRNPIIPGFAPDPSCVYVDGWYYLVNSSFYAFPGLPIYCSNDLSKWNHIGNAINRPDQLSLDNALTVKFPMGPDRMLMAAEGLLAPSIRHHKGTFYVICTNVTSHGLDLDYKNFYVQTTDIRSDSWSDPIYFDFRGIDPSLFFDDDDRVYIQGSYRAGPVWDPQCSIGQFEVDINTGKALSPIKHIWLGALGNQDAEGPHIYKKDGYYYLLAAEDGTFEKHAITMARSASIWGPYEGCPNNPVLCAFGSEKPVQHTGHGDLFQAPDGQWWCVCLAVRPEDGRYPLSRETFLTPVSWPKDEWPTFTQPQLEFSIPLRNSVETGVSSDSFERGDVYIRTPDLANYRRQGSTIWMTPSTSALCDQSGRPSFLGRRQRALDSSASVRLNLSNIPSTSSLKAGLTVYKDEYRHAYIALNMETKKVVVEVYTHDAEPRLLAEHPIPNASFLEFRIQTTASLYTFSYLCEADNIGWQKLGSIDTDDLSTYDFVGPLFGIFAQAQETQEPEVCFERFSIEEC